MFALRRALALHGLGRAPLRRGLPCGGFLRGLLAPAPQFLGGEPRALSQRLELGPLDGRMHALMGRLLGKAAIGARDHVLAADEFGKSDNTLADQLRMLDHVADMAD